MRKIAVVVSVLALAVTFATPVGFYLNRIDLDAVKLWMLAATIAWFAATPFWMDRKG